MPASNYVTVNVTRIIKETEKAFLIEVDDGEVWIPMWSVADSDDYREGMEGDISMSIVKKVADEKGLSYEEA